MLRRNRICFCFNSEPTQSSQNVRVSTCPSPVNTNVPSIWTLYRTTTHRYKFLVELNESKSTLSGLTTNTSTDKEVVTTNILSPWLLRTEITETPCRDSASCRVYNRGNRISRRRDHKVYEEALEEKPYNKIIGIEKANKNRA